MKQIKIGIIIVIIILGGYWFLHKSSKTTVNNQAEKEIINEETPFFTDVSPDEAKNLIANNNKLVIVDVSGKYIEGHLPGAINWPIGQLESKLKELDKTRAYLVYGREEAYSQAAASRLSESGIEDVYRLEGGMEAWAENKGKIEK